MFLRISSNFCPLNLLLVQCHQAEIIIVKRLIQRRSNVTRVLVARTSCDHGRCENDSFAFSSTRPTNSGFINQVLDGKHFVDLSCSPLQ